MDKTEEFYKAFTYLEKHYIFDGELGDRLYIDVVKVDPKTLSVENDENRNTLVQVWIECSIVSDEPLDEFETEHDVKHCWDYRLDVGGDTFEDAIINLAKRVKKYYPDCK